MKNHPPELQRKLDEMVEDAVNDWIEQKHDHDVVNICGETEDDDNDR